MQYNANEITHDQLKTEKPNCEPFRYRSFFMIGSLYIYYTLYIDCWHEFSGEMIYLKYSLENSCYKTNIKRKQKQIKTALHSDDDDEVCMSDRLPK